MADAPAPYVWGATDSYEAYIGRWSRPLAQAFLVWFAVPTAGRWLDVGCGTGALTEAVLATADPRAVLGIDPTPAFLAAAHARIADPRVRFAVGDARDLPVATDSYDAVVAGLVLNFISDPTTAVAEMARVTRPGGAVGAYVWDYRGEFQLLRSFWDAATAIDPAATALDPRPHMHPCQPDSLAALFRSAGLDDVAVDAIDLPMRFRDLDDYWLPNTMVGASAAQRYASALDADRKAALREQLRATLPTAVDGSIDLIGRAWAVRGTKRTA